jgi:prepilin-type N-terminal cleavage/methylation domain-containing protein
MEECMLTGLWRRAVRRAHASRTRDLDGGFTLVEVIVSIVLITIVTTALSTFFLTTTSATSMQSTRQTAVQLAQDAIERARSLKGSAILTGRDKCGPTAACTAPDAAGVGPYLVDIEEWDHANGTPAQLDTTGHTVTVNGLTYTQNWYVGKCWQAAGGGSCAKDSTTGPIMLLRVIAAVTWADKKCPLNTAKTANVCSYVTSTLVSTTTDAPLFNSNQTAIAPAVNNPGNQTDDVTWPVNLQLTATGGAPPVSWTATGLPPGLSIVPTGLVSGTPTSTGTWSVTVKATDGFNLSSTAAFTWTIKPVPTVTSPAAQSGEATVPVTAVQVTVTNGVAPYTWSATGLPPGLSVDGTGKITGTPTAAGTYKVVVTATDAKGKGASTNQFTWTVIAAPLIGTPTGVRTDTSNQVITVTATATGGTGAGYSWSATNLPAGLSINASTGKITGTLGLGTRYLTTLTVSDSAGGKGSTVIDWSVLATGTDLRVSSTTGDRTNQAGTAITSFTVTASNGASGYTWSSSGLPAGISVTTGGTLSGTPTAPGTYTVTLTVRDSAAKMATYMFVWTIQ